MNLRFTISSAALYNRRAISGLIGFGPTTYFGPNHVYSEGVENTRNGGFELCFGALRTFPFFSWKAFLFLLSISVSKEVEDDTVFYPGSLANHKLHPVHLAR